MIKKFYLFTYKDYPNVYYSDRDVFKSKIFNSLYSKLGDNSFKWRVRKNFFFSFLFERFFRKKIQVPNEKVKVVYMGYDSMVFFELDDSLEVKKVFRKTKGDENFVEEPFLGYTPDIFDVEKFSKVFDVLCDFFQKHWLDVKKDKEKLHGDLVPSNICIKGGKITLIDAKRIYSDSIIFDHLYFYCYAYRKIEGRKKISGFEREKLLKILKDLLSKSFDPKDKKLILKEVENLKLKKTPFRNFDSYVKKFVLIFTFQ